MIPVGPLLVLCPSLPREVLENGGIVTSHTAVLAWLVEEASKCLLFLLGANFKLLTSRKTNVKRKAAQIHGSNK